MICRRTACKTTVDVVCKHRDTGEMYCTHCAFLINRNCQEIVVHYPFVVGEKVQYQQQEAEVVGNNHLGAYRLKLADGTEVNTYYQRIVTNETATA